MKIVTTKYGKMDDRLYGALRNSLKECAPDLVLDIEEFVPDPSCIDRFRGKMQALTDYVCRQVDGEWVLMLDADVLVLRDPRKVITLGVRSRNILHSPRTGKVKLYPYNTGAIFVRVCDETRVFMKEWNRLTVYWGDSKARIGKADAQHGGTDQMAFAQCLKKQENTSGVFIGELNDEEWNLCEEYSRFNPDKCGILHFKGKTCNEIGLSGFKLKGNPKLHPRFYGLNQNFSVEFTCFFGTEKLNLTHFIMNSFKYGKMFLHGKLVDEGWS